MIILFNGYGYYSNRLFQNLHFEAFCIEHSIPYSNPTFHDLSDYYVSPPNLGAPQTVKFLQLNIAKYIIKSGVLGKSITFKDENQDNASLLLKYAQQDCCVDGWGFRVYDLTEKYQDLFIQRYSIKEEFYAHNNLFQEQLRVDRQTTALVGVHVRRGDYRRWKGGRYFFDNQVYMKNMSDLETKIAKQYGKTCLFIIFSNEPASFKNSFQKISNHNHANIRISENAWYVDHLLMSKCDFLIGPPSTFTLWASYLGKNKFFHITDASGVVDLEAFTYCHG